MTSTDNQEALLSPSEKVQLIDKLISTLDKSDKESEMAKDQGRPLRPSMKGRV